MSETTRPSWADYWMSQAHLIATRATCSRKKVGAVITTSTNRIVSTGYNGAPGGMPHCDDVGHLMKEIDGRPSCIRTLHAEDNAITQGGPRCVGCDMWLTVTPCYDCIKRACNVGIKKVTYGEYYQSRNTDLVEEFCRSAGIVLVKWEGDLVLPGSVRD